MKEYISKGYVYQIFNPSCSHGSMIVWLHHLDFNKTNREIARLELHKDAVWVLEQTLEVASYKTIAVHPLTFHLTNHSSKRGRHPGRSGRNKDDIISVILPWSPAHRHTSVGQVANTFICSVQILDVVQRTYREK